MAPVGRAEFMINTSLLTISRFFAIGGADYCLLLFVERTEQFQNPSILHVVFPSLASPLVAVMLRSEVPIMAVLQMMAAILAEHGISPHWPKSHKPSVNIKAIVKT